MKIRYPDARTSEEFHANASSLIEQAREARRKANHALQCARDISLRGTPKDVEVYATDAAMHFAGIAAMLEIAASHARAASGENSPGIGA